MTENIGAPILFWMFYAVGTVSIIFGLAVGATLMYRKIRKALGGKG